MVQVIFVELTYVQVKYLVYQNVKPRGVARVFS